MHRMRPSALVILAALCPTLILAQSRDSSHPVRKLTVFHGAASFSVPTAWHVLSETDTGSLGQYIYHIRNPRLDSISDERANVIVNIRRRAGSRAFKAFTDTLLGDLVEPSIIILQDTIIGKAQRALFWRGQVKTTPYAGYDDFAQNGELSIHIRIVMPLSDKTPTSWTRQFSNDSERLLQSVQLAGRHAFPALVGYPAVVGFGTSPAARPNER